jgi:hypothetical protein
MLNLGGGDDPAGNNSDWIVGSLVECLLLGICLLPSLLSFIHDGQ